MENKEINSIKIIGISLNDFVRDENEILHKAWKTIEEYIVSDKPPRGVESIEIQALIIDPMSNGAYLRGTAEGTEDSLTRIAEDVLVSMRHFKELARKAKNVKVRFNARIYRTPPILYLVWTPLVAFVQQYYFRPRHSADINIPVIQYHSKENSQVSGSSIHDELNFHFNWIWDHASISLDEYFNDHLIGIDEGARESNIINIYYEKDLKQERSRQRILHLISKTKKILWIKGISLKSFFKYGDLFDSISNACLIETLDIRILLIDPNSEQARLRSFREFLMIRSDSKLDEFSDDERKKQRLYKDTMDSIANISDHLKELNSSCTNHNFKARIFFSAAEAFTLITDDGALVEQYHYGKIRPTQSQDSKGKILGGDFPVVEYKRNDNDVFDPYRILKDHFNYIFNNCSSELPLDV